MWKDEEKVFRDKAGNYRVKIRRISIGETTNTRRIVSIGCRLGGIKKWFEVELHIGRPLDTILRSPGYIVDPVRGFG